MNGVRVGQVIGWQVLVAAIAVAASRPGPVSWAVIAAALLGCVLTMARWRHRWAYQWLITAWTHRREASGSPARPIEICPARLRSGTEAGIAHDGNGFAVIVAIEGQPAGQPVFELPASTLAGLLDPHDTSVSAVQLVCQAELAGQPVPRSQSAWLALRHDPALSRYAVGSAGSARDVQVSLLRGLAGRGARAVDLMSGLGLKGRVLDVPAARELLTRTLIELPGGQACWDAWQSSGEQHVTYGVRRWPAGGIAVLQQVLNAVPARSVTTSVLLTPAQPGQLGLAGAVRVTIAPGADRVAVDQAVRAGAASCGAQLMRLDGRQLAGVMATLPLGRPPTGLGGPQRCGSGATFAITAGGVVIGPQAGGADDGGPVAIPFFTGAGTRTAVIGDPLLHRLVGLRALGSGARLQIVTSRPGPWLKLRAQAGQPDRISVARPGKQPPSDGTRGDPWLVIDDTGSAAVVAGSPWLAAVSALGEPAGQQAIPPGYDSVVIGRSSQSLADSVAASFDLGPQAARSLRSVPDGQVAIVRPGLLRFARLVPDPAERSVLAGSMKSG